MSRALAASLHVPFEPLDLPRDACPLSDGELVDADKSGLLLLRIGGELIVVVAPRVLTARRLVDRRAPDPGAALPADHGPAHAPLHRCAMARTKSPSAPRRICAKRGRNSPAAPRPWRLGAGWLAAAAAYASAAIVVPHSAGIATTVALALTFLAWTALRLDRCRDRLERMARAAHPARRSSGLHRHHRALRRGRRDRRTDRGACASSTIRPRSCRSFWRWSRTISRRATAIAQLDLGPPFEIVIAPGSGPRTKPKALNAALAFARGTFTAVFDAEDRPAPDQFHRALDAFLGSHEEIACVQARLTIDNTGDGWLSRGIMAHTPQAIHSCRRYISRHEREGQSVRHCRLAGSSRYAGGRSRGHAGRHPLPHRATGTPRRIPAATRPYLSV